MPDNKIHDWRADADLQLYTLTTLSTKIFILPSYAINTYYLLATVHGGAVVTRSDFQREPSSSHFNRTISVPLPLHKIQRFTESRKVRLRIVISNP